MFWPPRCLRLSLPHIIFGCLGNLAGAMVHRLAAAYRKLREATFCFLAWRWSSPRDSLESPDFSQGVFARLPAAVSPFPKAAIVNRHPEEAGHVPGRTSPRKKGRFAESGPLLLTARATAAWHGFGGLVGRPPLTVAPLRDLAVNKSSQRDETTPALHSPFRWKQAVLSYQVCREERLGKEKVRRSWLVPAEPKQLW